MWEVLQSDGQTPAVHALQNDRSDYVSKGLNAAPPGRQAGSASTGPYSGGLIAGAELPTKTLRSWINMGSQGAGSERVQSLDSGQFKSASWQDASADRCTPRVPQRAGCGLRWRFQPPFMKLATGDSTRLRLALKRLCSWRGLMGWPMYPITRVASWV